MERIDDLISVIREMRADMNRRFDAVDRRFEAVDRRFEAVDARFDSIHREMHLNFRWIVGIQLTTMAAIVAALIQVAFR
jgi:hypothetical protein